MSEKDPSFKIRDDGFIQDLSRKGQKISWEEMELTWNNSNYDWDEVVFIFDIFGRGPYQKEKLKKLYDDLQDDTRYKVIKLICKVKGVEYRMDRVKLLDAEVTADDIQLVLDEAHRIEKSVIVENVNV
tara:strand:- start:97 stop:480 length:384 start_codon:yes stop_codon:yes gene_type:complete